MLKWFKREFFHLLPVFIFFLLAFSFVNLNMGLMLKRQGVHPFPIERIIIAAFLVAKIFLVLDHTRLIHLFSRKALIYQIIWKTSLYSLGLFLIQALTRVLPYYWHREADSLASALLDFNWPLFWGVQIWNVVLLFQFVTFREVQQYLGAAKCRQMFLTTDR